MIGKTTEKNNLTIPLDVSCTKTEKIYPTYISKQNSNSENKLLF